MKNLIYQPREWHGIDFDQAIWNFGNCFRLRREATQERTWMKEYLANIHMEHEEELAHRVQGLGRIKDNAAPLYRFSPGGMSLHIETFAALPYSSSPLFPQAQGTLLLLY